MLTLMGNLLPCSIPREEKFRSSRNVVYISRATPPKNGFRGFRLSHTNETFRSTAHSPPNNPCGDTGLTVNQYTAPSPQAKRPKPKRALGDASRADVDPAAKKRPRAPSWERDYQQIWKAVTDLGAEQFTGKEKKAYEARKIVDRGGRVSSLCGLVRDREANTAVGRMAVSSRKMVCSASSTALTCVVLLRLLW